MNAPYKPARLLDAVYRRDPKRPGMCVAWRINYRREQDGRVTRCQDGERFYASKADAETDAEFARRHDDRQLARLYGPLIAEVREVFTSIAGIKRGAVHASSQRRN